MYIVILPYNINLLYATHSGHNDDDDILFQKHLILLFFNYILIHLFKFVILDTIINELSEEVLIRLYKKIQVKKSIIVDHVNIKYNEDAIIHELIVPEISKM